MNFLSDYTVALDCAALVAIAILALVALSRRGTLWMGLFAVVAVIWVGMRLFQIL